MKKTALLFTIGVLVLNIVSASIRTTRFSTLIAATDTIKKMLTTQCRESTVCDRPECIQSLLDSIKLYPASSYLLIYKIAGSQYVLDKTPSIETLLNYKINKIMILKDKIRINDVGYYDKKRAIIVE